MKQRARASVAIAVAASLVGFAANADEAPQQRQSSDDVSADSSERSVLGIRGSYTKASVSGTGDHGGGLVLTGFGDAFRGQGALSARASHLFAIGGGTAGFEGALAGLIAVGLRVPTGRRGGLFIRGAVRGELLGNDLFYTSRLELPEGQLGYQFVSADVRFEAGLSLAPVLVGRFRIADQSRNLGGTLAMGGFATLQTVGSEFTLEAVRLSVDGAGGTNEVRMAQARACARAAPVALCADLRALQGDSPGGATARALTGGLTLAVTRP